MVRRQRGGPGRLTVKHTHMASAKSRKRKSNRPNGAALAGALEGFGSTRVAVIGDVMLDRYAYGDVGRISPEAPIPVFRHRRVVAMPGGAGNVVRNIAALGGKGTLVGNSRRLSLPKPAFARASSPTAPTRPR
jgi:hypothetical protein